MNGVLGDKDVIARLKAQRFELNKLGVIEYIETYFSTKGVGHLCDAESTAYVKKGWFTRDLSHRLAE